MANSVMGVEAVAAESARKSVNINRESSKVISIEKAMGNFCKLLANHDDRENRVDIVYKTKITTDCRIVFDFFRPNSEGYDYITYMRVGLEEKAYDGKWYGGCKVHADVMDSRDVCALVEEMLGKAKSYYWAKTDRSSIELMTAILAA